MRPTGTTELPHSASLVQLSGDLRRSQPTACDRRSYPCPRGYACLLKLANPQYHSYFFFASSYAFVARLTRSTSS